MNNVPDSLLAGEELPTFKFELEKSAGKVDNGSEAREATVKHQSVHRDRPQHDNPLLATGHRNDPGDCGHTGHNCCVPVPRRNPRHLIPSVAVPVSILGTFGAMYLLGYSLDILSLMALTIATGFVVDDAIVVLENISRHIEAGMSRLQAALLGAREVGFTVLSISLSLVAVFTPILLLRRHPRPVIP